MLSVANLDIKSETNKQTIHFFVYQYVKERFIFSILPSFSHRA